MLTLHQNIILWNVLTRGGIMVVCDVISKMIPWVGWNHGSAADETTSAYWQMRFKITRIKLKNYKMK